MELDRRRVLGGLAATSTLTCLPARAGHVVDVDVVIIGAGVAGIAAGQALSALGISYRILEARDRVGGRVVTDTQSLGRRFDRGAYWLHNKAQNPLVPLARSYGTKLLPSSYEDGGIFEAGQISPRPTWGEVSRAMVGWEMRQALSFGQGRDVALADILPQPSPAQRHLLNVFAVEMGDDPALISRDGYQALAAGEDLIPETGMGSLVSRLGLDLPISLASPIERVIWNQSHGVTVVGRFGQLRAKAALITVPTGVLARDGIRFDPALPAFKTKAIADLPMGGFEKVAMVLEQALPDLPEYALSNRHIQVGQYHALVTSPDKNMVTALLPGGVSRPLLREGPAALADFAQSLLREVVGTAARVQKQAGTNWQEDVFSLGSYCHPRIGATYARRDYGLPVEDRLFFAGDGCEDALAVTVSGAWRHGRRAAEEIRRVLKA